MTLLLHLDEPNQFSVYRNGKVLACIRRRDGAWRLFRKDRERQAGYAGVDVTRLIFQPGDLEPAIERHLSET